MKLQHWRGFQAERPPKAAPVLEFRIKKTADLGLPFFIFRPACIVRLSASFPLRVVRKLRCRHFLRSRRLLARRRKTVGESVEKYFRVGLAAGGEVLLNLYDQIEYFFD